MKWVFRPILPKMNRFNSARYLRELENERHKLAVEIRGDYEKTTATWQHKPNFGITRRGDDWYVATRDEIFGYVSEGTRPHTIVPKNAKRLHFFTGGKAKTKVKWIGSGPGRKGSNEVYAKSVHHPGTKAREFNKVIKNKWQKIWLQRMNAALRRASGG